MKRKFPTEGRIPPVKSVEPGNPEAPNLFPTPKKPKKAKKGEK